MLSRVEILADDLREFAVWTAAFVVVSLLPMIIAASVFLGGHADLWAAGFLIALIHPLYWMYWALAFALYFFASRSDSLRIRIVTLAVQTVLTWVVFGNLAYVVANSK